MSGILWRHTDKQGDRITVVVPPAGGITVVVDRADYRAPGAVWLSRAEAAALASALINGRAAVPDPTTTREDNARA